MLQKRFKSKFVFKLVIAVDDMGLDDLHFAGTVGEVNQSLIAKLELALEAFCLSVKKRDQVCLTERRVRLNAELCGGHHSPEEALRSRFRQFRVSGQRREDDPRESFRRDNRRECFGDLLLHLLDVLLHGMFSTSLNISGLCLLLNQSAVCHGLYLRFFRLLADSHNAIYRKFVVRIRFDRRILLFERFNIKCFAGLLFSRYSPRTAGGALRLSEIRH